MTDYPVLFDHPGVLFGGSSLSGPSEAAVDQQDWSIIGTLTCLPGGKQFLWMYSSELNGAATSTSRWFTASLTDDITFGIGCTLSSASDVVTQTFMNLTTER